MAVTEQNISSRPGEIYNLEFNGFDIQQETFMMLFACWTIIDCGMDFISVEQLKYLNEY